MKLSNILMISMLILSIASPLLIQAPVEAAFSGLGSGTVADPYQITTESQFWEIDDDVTANYTIQNNITFTSIEHAPITSSENIFTGSLNGQNYTLTDINITGNGNCGLIGVAGGATIKNINIYNMSIITSEAMSLCSGLILGTDITNPVSISNCHVRNSISRGFETYVGGIAGQLLTVSNINNCSVENCILCGSSCGSNIGGIAGISRGEIEQCFVDEDCIIEGQYSVGGICGKTLDLSDATILDCYSRAQVQAYDETDIRAGGICGDDDSTATGYINNTYTSSDVMDGTGEDPGIGQNAGSFIGMTAGNTAGKNCFFETGKIIDRDDFATGKATANMKLIATFTDTATEGLTTAWDFVGTENDDSANQDIWDINASINDGYPYLVHNAPYEEYASNVCVVYTTNTPNIGDIGSNVFNILGIVFIIGAIVLLIGVVKHMV